MAVVEGRLRLEDTFIVDVDVHLHETPGALMEYCDMPWRKSLESIKDVPERYLDIPGFSPGGPGSGGYTPSFPGGINRRMVHTPEQMREELDDLSIDLGILIPDHFLKFALIAHAEYAEALARAYNRWLIDKWLTRSEGLYGALLAAPQDPASAAREILALGKEEKIVGVYLPTCGVYPLYGNRKYDPIFEASEEMRLPLILHAVGGTHNAFPYQLEQFETEFARHALAHPFSIMANLTHMISTGVPARFPNLRVCLQEVGISWVPFMMMRLDKEYSERRREVPYLSDRPSEYIKRQFVYSTQPIEEPADMSDVATLIRLFDGEDSVLYASDWPHHDFDHPRTVFNIPVPAEVKSKIMGENAIRFFKLPVPIQARL